VKKNESSVSLVAARKLVKQSNKDDLDLVSLLIQEGQEEKKDV